MLQRSPGESSAAHVPTEASCCWWKKEDTRRQLAGSTHGGKVFYFVYLLFLSIFFDFSPSHLYIKERKSLAIGSRIHR